MTTQHKVLFASEHGFDYLLLRQILDNLLPRSFFHHFSTGGDLLAQLESPLPELKPDLIILDLFLPDFGGLELSEIIIKLNCCRETPMLVIGDFSREHVEELGTLKPEWRYVQKSNRIDQLESDLRAALENIFGARPLDAR